MIWARKGFKIMKRKPTERAASSPMELTDSRLIESQHHIDLDPLQVGDSYVVFLFVKLLEVGLGPCYWYMSWLFRTYFL